MFIELEVPRNVGIDDTIKYVIKTSLFKFLKLNLSEDISNKTNSLFRELDIDISLNQLINLFLENLKYSENKDGICLIEVDKEYKISSNSNKDYSLEYLIRLVDKGNLNWRGIHLFDSSLYWLQRNFNKFLLRITNGY